MAGFPGLPRRHRNCRYTWVGQVVALAGAPGMMPPGEPLTMPLAAATAAAPFGVFQTERG